MNTGLSHPSVECRCEGSPYEMGLQQGRALRKKIGGVRLSLRDLEAFRSEQPRWLPYPLFLRLSEARCEKALMPARLPACWGSLPDPACHWGACAS